MAELLLCFVTKACFLLRRREGWDQRAFGGNWY